MSTSSAMTDQERDEIDSAAQDFIHSCSEKIETLQQQGTVCMHSNTMYMATCILSGVDKREGVLNYSSKAQIAFR